MKPPRNEWVKFPCILATRVADACRIRARELGYNVQDFLRLAIERELKNPRVPSAREHWGRPYLPLRKTHGPIEPPEPIDNESQPRRVRVRQQPHER